jgi:hypothetical protein
LGASFYRATRLPTRCGDYGSIRQLLGGISSLFERHSHFPPEGRARWAVHLLTEEVVKRKLVPRVGRETIRALLESHDLKPWRGKNVVRGGTG